MEKLTVFFIKPMMLFILVLNLGSCALERVPLSENERRSIRSSQEKLSADRVLTVNKPDTPYIPGGGVAGIIVVNILQDAEHKRQEKKLELIQAQFKNNSIANLINQKLSQHLSTISWLHLKHNELSNKLSTSQKIQQVNQLKNIGDAIVYVDMSYQLTGFLYRGLEIQTNVSIYKKDMPSSHLIYENNFEYYDALEINPKKDFMSVWIEQDGKKIQESIQKAANLLSKVIAKDISDSTIKPNREKPTNVWYENASSPSNTGYLEYRDNDRDIIRTSTGRIVIIKTIFVSQKHNWRE